MSKLKNSEIDYIFETYKEVKSIEKTSKITGFSKVTVNNYVRDISSKDVRSRNCINRVKQIDPKTGEVIDEWDKPAYASKELGISLSEICRVLKGELKQAGGFRWRYSNKRK